MKSHPRQQLGNTNQSQDSWLVSQKPLHSFQGSLGAPRPAHATPHTAWQRDGKPHSSAQLFPSRPGRIKTQLHHDASPTVRATTTASTRPAPYGPCHVSFRYVVHVANTGCPDKCRIRLLLVGSPYGATRAERVYQSAHSALFNDFMLHAFRSQPQVRDFPNASNMLLRPELNTRVFSHSKKRTTQSRTVDMIPTLG